MINFPFLAFLLFHLVVPAVCVLQFGANPLWLLGTALFSIAVFRTASSQSGSILKWILCFLSGLWMLLAMMLGVSYYMQGTGFNSQFFFHLDWETVDIAVRAYPRVLFPALMWLALAFFAPLLFYGRPTPRISALPATVTLWLTALAACYPLHSLVAYRMGLADEMSSLMPQLPPMVITEPDVSSSSADSADDFDPESQAGLPPGALKKNIILIYAEGLEQLYFDQEVFGDLLPNLRQLSKQAHRFTNVYQVPGTSWTIAGIVASQCGFPLVVSNHLAGNSTMASTERPFETEICLADVLRDSGYSTVYMGGAPLAFAGKGNFLRTHGYAKVLGKDELTPFLADPGYSIGWGLHDDSLFELALDELKTLENGDQPYLLTLLTLGTHHPSGFVAKSCKQLPGSSDPMSQAIYCSDQLISEFIRKAIETVDMSETVIVLFSDHLALRNILWDKLQANKDRRRLTWMVFDDRPGTSSDRVATHFDVAPTLLETAGISAFPRLGQGTSLLSQTEPAALTAPPTVEPRAVPRSLVSDESIRVSGFEISYASLTISVGELAVKANKNGWKFESGLFLFVFDEEGHVADTIYSDDFAQLIEALDGRFVAGVSIHGPTSVYEDQYFFGRLSPDLRNFKVLALDADVRVEAAELNF